jgi:hypothetical protein
MYCKKCNINVKKDRKVCPKCGMALVPGEAKGDRYLRVRRIIIIASVIAVAVIAFFVFMHITVGVPSKLMGTWYEVNGYGYVNFKTYGDMTMTGSGYTTEGTYTYNSDTGEGTITIDEKEQPFTCDGTKLEWGGSTMTKTYVEQLEYDWGNLFNQLG